MLESSTWPTVAARASLWVHMISLDAAWIVPLRHAEPASRTGIAQARRLPCRHGSCRAMYSSGAQQAVRTGLSETPSQCKTVLDDFCSNMGPYNTTIETVAGRQRQNMW